MGQQVHVVVTQEDIDNGVARNCRECPIALALKRTLDMHAEEFNVSVGNQLSFRPHANSYRVYAQIPQRAAEFANMFDNGVKVAPFEFDVEFF